MILLFFRLKIRIEVILIILCCSRQASRALMEIACQSSNVVTPTVWWCREKLQLKRLLKHTSDAVAFHKSHHPPGDCCKTRVVLASVHKCRCALKIIIIIQSPPYIQNCVEMAFARREALCVPGRPASDAHITLHQTEKTTFHRVHLLACQHTLQPRAGQSHTGVSWWIKERRHMMSLPARWVKMDPAPYLYCSFTLQWLNPKCAARKISGLHRQTIIISSSLFRSILS